MCMISGLHYSNHQIFLVTGAAGILGLVMGIRFFKSGKFKLMPAGLVFILR